jgi:putative transposase
MQIEYQIKGGHMLNVVKVRLYPNKAQKELIHKTFGSSRFVYNILLDAKIKAYECGDNVSVYDLKERLVPMKKARGGGFLKEVDSTALQNSVLKIQDAYEKFFKRLKNGQKGGYPRFKTKHSSRQTYQTSTAKIKNDKLFLPKIGEIKAIFHRGPVAGKIKTVTVSFEAGQYHASINYEDGLKETIKTANGKSIGLDMGVKVFAYTSENIKIKHIDLNKEISNVIKAQRTLSRRKRGGKNRLKAKEKLAKKHLKLKNKRNDFLHKESKKLSENQTIAIENLKIKNMSKKAKASIENPNMRASSKRSLNRAILRQGWGKFFELLEYKLERNGGSLVKVDPKFTSQKCSCCGHISKNNRITQAKFVCESCSSVFNADHNAAINILNAAGSAVYAF